MLGRLFKLSGTLGVQPQTQPLHSSSGTATNTNTYDDSYTREILYSSQTISARPPGLNSRRFRLVVCQDGGNLRCKQVLFDSAAELAPGLPAITPGAPSSPVSSSAPTDLQFGKVPLPRTLSSVKINSKNILLSKQLYNVNDLNDYMFGRGLPTNESFSATKIHLLPHVNLVYGAYRAVLVTRLFLIIDENNAYADSAIPYDPEWHPAAALPVKDAYFRPSENLGKTPATGGARSLFHSRFAIGIVIPLESPDLTVQEILSCHWDVLSHYLVILLKVVTKKLVLALKYSTVNQVCPYITNRRIQFPPNILRSDFELMNQLGKLVRLVYFTYTPRLMSSNLLIRHCIDHPDSRFKSLLLNWALEVVNWLEFKDGRNLKERDVAMSTQTLSRTFLASLLAILVPLRDLLTLSPMSLTGDARAPNMPKYREITRVVVMTGNSAVAKKLIFILNGLIPDTELVAGIGDQDTLDSLLESECAVDDTENESNPIPIVRNGASIHQMHPPQSSYSEHSKSPDSVDYSVTKPIPIRMNPIADSHDELSGSVNSTRGWEVPVKTSTSLSFSNAKKPSFTTEMSAHQITTHGNGSASNLSVSYLSLSLNSSLSSSASNYSLSKLGGSFVDKWRNSFGHSYLQDTTDPVSETLNKRPSVLSLRTPSPAFEQDEPLWESIGEALVPSRLRISRTQSMLDLYQHKVGCPSSMSAVSVQRTMSSVYMPLQGVSGRLAPEANSDAIRRKCKAIMGSRIAYTRVSGLVVAVLPTVHVTSSVFEQSTITSQKSTGEDVSQISRQSILPPTVAFVDEFRPEYVVQSCPVSTKLEMHVMNAMKNDLLFFQNNCDYERVTSRTVFISLRAREIKLIEMNVGQDRSPISPTPSTSPKSLVEGAERRHTNYSTVVKKIFSPKTVSGNREVILWVAGQLEKLTHVVANINNDGAETTDKEKEQYNRMLFQTVLGLVL